LSQLFVSYGDSWFTEREFLGPIPLTEDLVRANGLTQSFSRLYRNLGKKTPQARSTLKELWRQFVQEDAVYKNSRVLGAFNHSDPQEFELLQEGKDIAEIRTNQSMRSPEWLAQNGVCADHIGARPSTLPQAGHGAFGRRRLPRGSVVASLPLIHIPNRSVLAMYPVDLSGYGTAVDRDAEPAGYQLLLNYCFGHEATTLLLCPYGPHGAYFNHNQTQVNVKVVWSDPARSNHQPQYLDLSIEALAESSKSAKLSMDVVALRDLAEGEELFLDYGDAWEAAWKRHVESWTPPEASGSYVYAVARNRDLEAPLPTQSELEGGQHPDPDPDVELMCSAIFLDDVDWKSHYPDRLSEYLAKETLFGETNTYKCDITSRRRDVHGNYLYSAVAWTWDPAKDPNAVDLYEYATVVGVPRQAFAYFQRPYRSDTFLPTAFRHPIGIPDDLFSRGWRNV
jgi:SET domain